MPASAPSLSATGTRPLSRPIATAAYLLLIYGFASTFPGGYSPIGTGLDASWMYGLCELAGSPYLFGRDVAFTYGPLGFLLNPLEVGSCLSAGVVFWTVLHCLLFGAVAGQLRRHPSKLAVFSVGYVLLIGLGLWREYRVLAAVLALTVLSLEENSRSRRVLAAGAAVLSVFALELKWSTGIAAIAVTAGSWLLLFKSRKAPNRRAAGVGIATFVAAVIAAVLAFHRSPKSFWLWIRSSSEIASGYSSAMSQIGPGEVLFLAAISVFVLTAVAILGTREIRLRLALSAVPAFVAFKHGFVRQGGHSMAFFSTVCMIPLIVSIAPSISSRDVKRLISAFVALFAVALIYGGNYVSYPGLTWRGFEDILLLRTGAANLEAVLHFTRTRESLRPVAKSLATDVLPDRWQTRLKNSKVSILPWELSIGAANPIDLQPIPTLQLYTAYTQYLDHRTAEALQDRGAAYLVVSHQGLDGRNPMLDTPETWRSVMDRYQLDDSDVLGRRALLVRKYAHPEQLRRVSTGHTGQRQWVQIPASRKLLYAAIDLEYSWWGRLARTLYQVPEVRIELQRRSGRNESYRLLTETAMAGVLLNYLPANQQEFEDLIRGIATDPVTRFRVSAPAWYFEPAYDWTLSESSRGVQESGGDPKPPRVNSLTVSQNGAQEATIDVTASDPNGVRDLQFIQIIINRNLNGAGACYLSYEAAENRLWLIADTGAGAAGVAALGAKTTLSNQQCGIATEEVSASIVETALSLHIPIKFTGPFSGTMQVFGEAIDRGGLHPGFHPLAKLILK